MISTHINVQADSSVTVSVQASSSPTHTPAAAGDGAIRSEHGRSNTTTAATSSRGIGTASLIQYVPPTHLTRLVRKGSDTQPALSPTSMSLSSPYPGRVLLSSLNDISSASFECEVMINRVKSSTLILSTDDWNTHSLEVRLFAHCTRMWIADPTRMDGFNSGSTKKHNESSSVPASTSKDLVVDHLVSRVNGVYGPFGCIPDTSGVGSAILPGFINMPDGHTPSVSAFQIAEISQHQRWEEFEDSIGVLYPDIGGTPLSTLIRDWHHEDPSSITATQPLIRSVKWNSSSLKSALECFISIADQLDRLHHFGIILRAVSPLSIRYNASSGQSQFLDFSQATLLHRESSSWTRTRNLDVPQPLWPYMSPEMTGRTNRLVDHRTDLYSLGILFFEMLTGYVPFQSDDLVEVVYGHVSKPVYFPSFDCSSSPMALEVLQTCVLKLLSKSPEERYHTAAGLLHDLRYCLRVSEDKNLLNPEFFPGSTDGGGSLVLPQKLYGRDGEVRQLLDAYDVLQSPHCTGPQLVLVSGFSGIGKTAVVDEVHRPMIAARGLFAKSKFDLYRRHSSVLFHVFQSLITQIIASGDIDKWRSRLHMSLSIYPSCYLLSEVIPNLTAIIGPQPSPANPLPHTEAQILFQRMLVSFVGAFATINHPLVIFIDDLQWADSMSLAMIKHLFSCSQLHLLIIGAYRSNHVNSVHPLMVMLHELQQADLQLARDSSLPKNSTRMTLIHLAPLAETDVTHLVCDAFHCDEANASPLSQLLHQQTSGNPFFLVMLLHAYHEQGGIFFDYHKREWAWDLAALRLSRIGCLDNVVALLEQQVQQLSVSLREIMIACGCLGNSTDLETLAIVIGRSMTETARLVWPLMQLGFLVPTANAAEVFAVASSSSKLNESDLRNGDKVNFRFLHDSVQQASYQLLTEEERLERQLHIARALYAAAVTKAKLRHPDDEEAARESAVQASHDFVDKFNLARSLLTDTDEILLVIKMNSAAADRARSSTAYERYHYHTGMACELLDMLCKIEGSDLWEDRYSLAFDCWQNRCTSAFLQYSHDLAEHISLDLIKRTSSASERQPTSSQFRADHASAILLSAQVYGARPSTAPQCIEQTLKALPLLSVTLLTVDSDECAAIRAQDIMDWTHLPDATDMHHLRVMGVMASVLAVCYVTGKKECLECIIYTMLARDLRHGVSIYSSCALSYLSGTLCASEVAADVGKCVRAGQAGMNLFERFRKSSLTTASMIVRTVGPHYCISSPWGAHLSVSVPAFTQLRTTAVEGGEFEYAGYCVWHLTAMRFFTAEPLEGLEHDILRIRNHAMQQQQRSQADFATMTLQHVQKLLRKAQFDDAFPFDDKMMTDVQFSDQWLQGGTELFAHFLLSYRMQLLYYARDFAGASSIVLTLRKTRTSCAGLVYFAYDVYYSALAQIRAVPIDASLAQQLVRVVEQSELAEDVTDAHLPSVEENHAELDAKAAAFNFISSISDDVAYAKCRCKAWSIHAPMNFAHCMHLIEAEWLRLQSLVHSRRDLISSAFYRYQKAAELSAQHGYIQDAGLSFELHGRYCLELNMQAEAVRLLSLAFRNYQRWQCHFKVHQLQAEFQDHPEIFAAVPFPDLPSPVPATQVHSTTATPTSIISRSLSHTNKVQTPIQHLSRLSSTESTSASVHGPTLLGTPLHDNRSISGGEKVSTDSPSASSITDLDILTILRCAQAFGVEADSQSSLRAAMNTVLQSSGAERGVLVLANTEQVGEWKVELAARQMGSQVSSESSDLDLSSVPPSVFQYILATRETLVVSNPADLRSDSPLFPLMRDTYFDSHMPRAFLCMPVLQHNKVIGVLYLESTHPDAFHASQTLLLQLLSSQAALSIYNARLFSQLNLKNEELVERTRQLEIRTAEMEERNAQLKASKAETERISRVKADFLSNMSHEVRTPMNAVLGVSRLLESTSLSMEQHQYVSMINSSGQVLLSIVNDILDYSKMEAGAVILRLSPENPVNVIESAVMQCYGNATAKGLVLAWYIDPSIPSEVLLDSTRLQQILLNLLSNSIKFTKSGGIHLSVLVPSISSEDMDDVRSSPQGGIDRDPAGSLSRIKLCFEIRDTGIGMSVQQLSTLFRSFSQVRHSSGEYGGTGLGLVISERLVTAMGGKKIDVKSDVDQGSSFSFRIIVAYSPTPSLALNSISPTQDRDVYGMDPAQRAQLQRLQCIFVGSLKLSDACMRLLQAYGCTVRGFSSMNEVIRFLHSTATEYRSRKLTEDALNQLLQTVCDVFVVDLDAPRVHDDDVISALALFSPVRVMFLYSHLHALHTRSNGEDDNDAADSASGSSVSVKVDTEPSSSQKPSSINPFVPASFNANKPRHFLLEAGPAVSSSSEVGSPTTLRGYVARSIRAELLKPYKGSAYLQGVCALASEQFQAAIPALSTSSQVSESATSIHQVERNPQPNSGPPTHRHAKIPRPNQITNLSKAYPLRILLAEDNLINQKMMVMLLRRLGYEILVAANGIEALQLLDREAVRGREYEIECILMDASMDTMDGFECTRVIRTQQMPHRVRPFIIAQTANVTDDYRKRCAECEMDLFLAKPIQLEELTAVLQAAYQAQHPITSEDKTRR